MKLRAVIFDAVESVRELLAVALRDRGYEVLSFAEPSNCPLYLDPDNRCSCTQEYPCGDLLIIDQHMPDMTGLEFIERQEARGCKGVVQNKALLAQSLSPAERAKARELGCRVFYKPFRFRDFSQWLDSREKQISSDRRLVEASASLTDAAESSQRPS